MERRAILFDSLLEVAPFDELGDHEAKSLLRSPDIEHRNDVGMVEAGEDAGFVQERLNILGLRDPLWAWDFDRDGAIEIVIEGEEDLSEPAPAQASQDRVTPDLRGVDKGVGAGCVL